MAIQRKPNTAGKKSDADVDAFVDGAPDARKATSAEPEGIYEKGVPKGNKRQISLTISPDLLRRVDEVAKRSGQARAAVINMALYRALEGDIFK
ncbi:CopG family transcriptional regulator [Xanthomonas citri]|uniref:CopG family transcriptional regulator n=1 Tax=Xanthomonas citri TaxID=346 RepID=UPI0005B44968|nr:CopG family transcriptional regulator [Xanthomonas citri]TBX01118.1 CopG family transcriptional regulator [Xanthomonas citri pv. aurantifolii]